MESRLLFGRRQFSVDQEALTQTCALFKDNPDLLLRPYRVKSVGPDAIFRLFLAALRGEQIGLSENNVSFLSHLSDEFGFASLNEMIADFLSSRVGIESEEEERADLSEVISELRSSKEEVAEVQERVQTQQREIAILESEIRAWRGRAVRIGISCVCGSVLLQFMLGWVFGKYLPMARMDSEMARVSANVYRVSGESERLTQQFVRLSDGISRLSDDVSGLYREIPVLGDKLSRLSNELSRLYEGLPVLVNEFSRLSDEWSRLSSEVSDLAREFPRLSNESSRLSREIERLSDVGVTASPTGISVKESLRPPEPEPPAVTATPIPDPFDFSGRPTGRPIPSQLLRPFHQGVAPLDGIIRYLWGSSGPWVADNRHVRIVGMDAKGRPFSAHELEDSYSDDYWVSPPGTASYLLFDFKRRNVTVTHYTLASRPSLVCRSLRAIHPTQWRLQGSNDEETWQTLDMRSSKDLDGAGKFGTFALKQAATFRFLRFHFQHQPLSLASKLFVLSDISTSVTLAAVEFFGTLHS
jgi:predicted nuclease with TOPRIM domain